MITVNYLSTIKTKAEEAKSSKAKQTDKQTRTTIHYIASLAEGEAIVGITTPHEGEYKCVVATLFKGDNG